MLVNMSFKPFFLMFFIFLFLNSCKKKRDEVNPQVTVNTPLPNSLFDLPNSIRVSGLVEDDNSLKRVEISLLNESLSPVAIKTTIDLNTNKYVFDQLVNLDDPLIESGLYYIHVKAFDQSNNFSSVFVEIQISEVKRVLEGLFFYNK
jgi:hypothetical protein